MTATSRMDEGTLLAGFINNYRESADDRHKAFIAKDVLYFIKELCYFPVATTLKRSEGTWVSLEDMEYFLDKQARRGLLRRVEHGFSSETSYIINFEHVPLVQTEKWAKKYYHEDRGYSETVAETCARRYAFASLLVVKLNINQDVLRQMGYGFWFPPELRSRS